MIIFAGEWFFFFKNNYKIICKIESVYKETQLTDCFIVFPSPPPPLAVGVSCGPRFPTHSPDSGLGSSEHPGDFAPNVFTPSSSHEHSIHPSVLCLPSLLCALHGLLGAPS